MGPLFLGPGAGREGEADRLTEEGLDRRQVTLSTYHVATWPWLRTLRIRNWGGESSRHHPTLRAGGPEGRAHLWSHSQGPCGVLPPPASALTGLWAPTADTGPQLQLDLCPLDRT